MFTEIALIMNEKKATLNQRLIRSKNDFYCFFWNYFGIWLQGSTLRTIQNNLNRYDDWLCVWREGMWDDECSS
ncbi:hypothetical protein BpHYR1_021377 [Brachionus plicatilis]|uniref:Uncharacterized protein n=1 Tax=Brachionus plicatilis TaxID=10195 RepID=A0A3M7R7S6_BRAPC|nr:hypothetical protein BpHYR1_021377 [Brachionus plicatilis]